jgi:hypothetical protein
VTNRVRRPARSALTKTGTSARDSPALQVNPPYLDVIPGHGKKKQ